jgi:hypothetical protein
VKDLFYSYYKPTKKEFDEMWKEAIFVFDTNVLLDFYRYTPKTRIRLIDLIKYLQNRIWIPHQVAYEYHERRLDVISDQFKGAKAIEDQLTSSCKDIENKLNQYRKHSFANVDNLMSIIRKALEDVKATLLDAQNKHPDLLKSDDLLDEITQLFDGKVGQPYSEEELITFYEDAEERFKRKTPPGYEDAKDKHDQRKYGDVLVWYQIIDKAKSEKKSIIFVTGERKEDWWLRHSGRTIGPRRELINEMYTKADTRFYMYLTEQFIEQAEIFFNMRDLGKAIEEVREIRKQDEANVHRQLETFQPLGSKGKIIALIGQIFTVSSEAERSVSRIFASVTPDEISDEISVIDIQQMVDWLVRKSYLPPAAGRDIHNIFDLAKNAKELPQASNLEIKQAEEVLKRGMMVNGYLKSKKRSLLGSSSSD